MDTTKSAAAGDSRKAIYEDVHSSLTAQVIFLVMVGLIIGTLVRQVTFLTKIPFAPMMIAVGIIAQCASRDKYADINTLMTSPSYILKILFIPALVFGTALKADWTIFRK
jgi:NhaP-type Na+/H+ or K+/H+ antiporter